VSAPAVQSGSDSGDGRSQAAREDRLVVQTSGPSPPERQGEGIAEVGDGPPALPGSEAGSPDGSRRVDFAAVLGRVAGANPQVAFANQRVREALAQLRAAQTLWLPSIRAGVSYNKHEGSLQAVEGPVSDVSRSAMESGLGVAGAGAGSPPVPGVLASFRLTDAVFQPQIADQATAARQEAATATLHDVLLAVALAYLDLLRAHQQNAIAEETLAHAQQLADLTAAFARAGQGSEADADRARAELAVRKNDRARAEEATKVASARLAELLSWEPTRPLVPSESEMVAMELVAPETPLPQLVAHGLSSRPELAEARHLVSEAVCRLERERYAPLVPSVLLGASYGGFGGGPGSTVTNFRDRLDLDAAAFWELRMLGAGERAAREEARARIQQARLRQVQVMDRVAREIVEAHAQVESRRGQIAVAQSGVKAAEDSYRRNLERIRGGQGLPIEVLQSIQALDQSRREYLRAVAEYNEAEFRLHRALGWPIEP